MTHSPQLLTCSSCEVLTGRSSVVLRRPSGVPGEGPPTALSCILWEMMMVLRVLGGPYNYQQSADSRRTVGRRAIIQGLWASPTKAESSGSNMPWAEGLANHGIRIDPVHFLASGIRPVSRSNFSDKCPEWKSNSSQVSESGQARPNQA